MRFITLFGLVIIAKCIDPSRIAEIADLINFVLVIAFVFDCAEFIKTMTK
jgi:hypothetical protein